MAARPILLTIDDDPDVLRAIERDLRRQYGERYRVLRAQSGAEALKVLEQLKRRGEPDRFPVPRSPFPGSRLTCRSRFC